MYRNIAGAPVISYAPQDMRIWGMGFRPWGFGMPFYGGFGFGMPFYGGFGMPFFGMPFV